jgi:hypothetical protein
MAPPAQQIKERQMMKAFRDNLVASTIVCGLMGAVTAVALVKLVQHFDTQPNPTYDSVSSTINNANR